MPITKDALICLPKHLAQQYSNIGQFVVCLRVTEVITLINPMTLQLHEVNSLVLLYHNFNYTSNFRTTYWKDPFEILTHPKSLSEFYVLDVEEIENKAALLPQGHGNISNRHKLSDVWVVRR